MKLGSDRCFGWLSSLGLLALATPLNAQTLLPTQTEIGGYEESYGLDCQTHFGPVSGEFRINQFQGYESTAESA